MCVVVYATPPLCQIRSEVTGGGVDEDKTSQSISWVSSLFPAMTAQDRRRDTLAGHGIFSKHPWCGSHRAALMSSDDSPMGCTVNRNHISTDPELLHCGDSHDAGFSWVFSSNSHHVLRTKQWSRWINMQETDSISIFSMIQWVMLLRLPERTTESFAIINNQPWVRYFHWSRAQDSLFLFFRFFPLQLSFMVHTHATRPHTISYRQTCIQTPFLLPRKHAFLYITSSRWLDNLHQFEIATTKLSSPQSHYWLY